METATTAGFKEVFTSKWWEDFFNQTDGFNKHSVHREVFNKNEVNYLKNLVEDIIKNVTKDPSLQSYLRIWNNQKYNKTPSDFFKEHPIDSSESIENWKYRNMKNKKFGLFLNHVERHSEDLSQYLIKCFSPFIDNRGIPLGGISTTIILGDYGWTPLGIHNDELGEYIIHLHLGPGNKDIYIWDDDKSNLYGFDNKKKIENFEQNLKNCSYKINFSKGDIFSMTGKKFHIGNTNEFSIGLILEFNSLTEKEFFKKMWYALQSELFSRNYRGNKAKILPPFDTKNERNYKDYILKGIKHFNFNYEKNVENGLRKCYLDHKYKIISNKGFSYLPFHDLNKNIESIIDEIRNSGNIKIIEPFPIMFYQDDNYLNIFIRGSKFRVQFNESLIHLIEKLNEGVPIKISEYKTQKFTEWDDSAFFKLLYLFYVRSGISLQV